MYKDMNTLTSDSSYPRGSHFTFTVPSFSSACFRTHSDWLHCCPGISVLHILCPHLPFILLCVMNMVKIQLMLFLCGDLSAEEICFLCKELLSHLISYVKPHWVQMQKIKGGKNPSLRGSDSTYVPIGDTDHKTHQGHMHIKKSSYMLMKGCLLWLSGPGDIFQ